jgi:hypothetical protein
MEGEQKIEHVSVTTGFPDSVTMYAITVRKFFDLDGVPQFFRGTIPLLVCDTLTGAEDICRRFAAMKIWNGCEFEPEAIQCVI